MLDAFNYWTTFSGLVTRLILNQIQQPHPTTTTPPRSTSPIITLTLQQHQARHHHHHHQQPQQPSFKNDIVATSDLIDHHWSCYNCGNGPAISPTTITIGTVNNSPVSCFYDLSGRVSPAVPIRTEHRRGLFPVPWLNGYKWDNESQLKTIQLASDGDYRESCSCLNNDAGATIYDSPATQTTNNQNPTRPQQHQQPEEEEGKTRLASRIRPPIHRRQVSHYSLISTAPNRRRRKRRRRKRRRRRRRNNNIAVPQFPRPDALEWQLQLEKIPNRHNSSSVSDEEANQPPPPPPPPPPQLASFISRNKNCVGSDDSSRQHQLRMRLVNKRWDESWGPI